MTAEMTVDYSGTWDIISNVNFDGYMIALGETPYFNYTVYIKKYIKA